MKKNISLEHCIFAVFWHHCATIVNFIIYMCLVPLLLNVRLSIIGKVHSWVYIYCTMARIHTYIQNQGTSMTSWYFCIRQVRKLIFEYFRAIFIIKDHTNLNIVTKFNICKISTKSQSNLWFNGSSLESSKSLLLQKNLLKYRKIITKFSCHKRSIRSALLRRLRLCIEWDLGFSGRQLNLNFIRYCDGSFVTSWTFRYCTNVFVKIRGRKWFTFDLWNLL